LSKAKVSLPDVDIGQLASTLQTASDVGFEALKDIASAVNVDTLRDAGQTIAEHVGDAAEAIGDFWETGLVQDTTENAIEWIKDEGYAMSRSELEGAAMALAGIATIAIDWIKIEVVRDFFQIMSLFFSNLFEGLFDSAQALWGSIGSIAAVDFSTLIPTIPTQVMYGFLIVVALVIMMMFWCFMLNTRFDPDAIRDGHEVRGWKERSKDGGCCCCSTAKYALYMMQIIISLYLPLSKALFMILSNHPSWVEALRASGLEKNDTAFKVVAGIVILAYTCYVPYVCRQLIDENVPVGTLENPDIRYNDDGDEVPYDDEMYQEDIKTDPDQQANPYRFLYQGYERKHRHYKVFIMMIKLLLVMIVILGAKLTLLNQTFLAALVVLIYTVTSWKSEPFIDSKADSMEKSARVTQFVSLILGAIVLTTPEKDDDDKWIDDDDNVGESYALDAAIGPVLQGVQFLNAICMGCFFITGTDRWLAWRKNKTAQFTFSKDITETLECIVEKSALPEDFKLVLERRHRVWYPFWDSIMMNKCGSEVADRLADLKKATQQNGLKRIKSHWEREATDRMARFMAQNDMEGLDCFWDGVPNDGKLDSVTCFGKMYVIPYPFQIRLIYDDCDDYAFIRDEDIQAVVQRNLMDPVICYRRDMRQNLRALNGQEVRKPCMHVFTKTVKDGTHQETSTDGEGNTTTKTVQDYSTIKVDIHFTNGTFAVAQFNRHDEWSRGFTCKLHYKDGHGSAIKPRSGETAHFHDEVWVADHAELGITRTYENPTLLKWINEPTNNRKIPEGKQAWQNKCAVYRQGLMAERKAKEAILSSSFWYFIYSNDNLQRSQVESLLRLTEPNPALQTMPSDHSAGFDYLYLRMGHVNKHPCTLWWFTFWDDLWEENKEMTLMQDEEMRKALDPSESTSIAYSVFPRETLNAWLVEKNLKGAEGTDQKVSDRLLDALYGGLDAINKMAQEGRISMISQGAGVAPPPAAAFNQ
jgi:hypothetical protein